MFTRVIRSIVIVPMMLVALAAPSLAGQESAQPETADIPVPTGVIYPGQVISSSMLRPRTVPLRYLEMAGVFADRTMLVGMVARTTLMPAKPIGLNQVVEPDVIKVNQPTLMRYANGALTITAEVQPLNSAKAGEIVRVRTRFSKSVVTGVAQKDGTIRAGLQ